MTTNHRLLCISPHTDGLAIAVMTSPLEVTIRKIVKITPVSNRKVLEQIKEFIELYKPSILVTESGQGKNKRRRKRMFALLRSINKYCNQLDIPIAQYSGDEVNAVFDLWKARTRYERAQVIAENVNGFDYLLYAPPTYPKTEHYYSPLFDAVALGITHFYLSE